MGSSPVTATTTSEQLEPLARLDATLDDFFAEAAHPLSRRDGLCLAFSGGPDSLALLVGLVRLRERRGVSLVAAHLDHGLDAESSSRADAARALAASFGVPCTVARRPVAAHGMSLEAAARGERYAFLETVRHASESRYVVTAHHLDDQAETVALRLLLGSGLAGLGAIRPLYGRVARPLLALRRSALADVLAAVGLRGVEDSTNRLERFPRNRLRASILPRLAATTPDLAARLARLAERTTAANQALDRRLLQWFDARAAAPALRLTDLRTAPPPLQRRALSLLHRLSGRPLPPPRGAMLQVLTQLAAADRADCDCGDGRRWRADGGGLIVVGPPEPAPPSFTYTFEMPGHAFIPELRTLVEVRRAGVEPWMFQGSPWRAGLALPDGARLEVRSRRPGDRLRPLGGAGTRKLKDVFIDAKVPPARRERTPLLCADGEIAWVPGVTVSESFRLAAEGSSGEAWVAELRPA